MPTEPLLYTKNFITPDCEFAVSHDDSFIERLCDRDNDSQWISNGANSDATEVVIDITFKEGGQTIERDIDTLILVNHNLEDPILEYWDGAAFQSLDSETNLTDGSYTKMSFNSVSTEIIRIRNSQTITTNAEKAIGEIIACAELLDPEADMMQYRYTLVQRRANELLLGDGSLHRANVMHSPNRSSKYEVRGQFQFVDEDKLAEFQAVKESAEPFLFQPESVVRPDQIYLVNWVGSFNPEYASSYKGAGYNVPFEFKEV